MSAESVPVDEFYGLSEENEFFVTINPNLIFNLLVNKDAIKSITKLGHPDDQNPEYLIGPGPEVFLVTDLLQEQIAVYHEEKVNKLK